MLLIKYPDYTVLSISQDSGIMNVRTFHRLFRKKYGITPSKFRSINS
ncbi:MULTISPECIES: helix-turn-helix domain-containing protein [Bacteroidales]|nr:AraC family transcriptional regulator [Bacteroides sp. AM07-16]